MTRRVFYPPHFYSWIWALERLRANYITPTNSVSSSAKWDNGGNVRIRWDDACKTHWALTPGNHTVKWTSLLPGGSWRLPEQAVTPLAGRLQYIEQSGYNTHGFSIFLSSWGWKVEPKEKSDLFALDGVCNCLSRALSTDGIKDFKHI